MLMFRNVCILSLLACLTIQGVPMPEPDPDVFVNIKINVNGKDGNSPGGGEAAIIDPLYGCNNKSGPWWTPDYCWTYLLHWSSSLGNEDLARNLLDSGRDVNLLNPFVHRTAMHIAAHWGRASMVGLFLSRGADKTLLDYKNSTALDLAELKKCDDATYFETWKESCTRAENNYPITIKYLKDDKKGL